MYIEKEYKMELVQKYGLYAVNKVEEDLSNEYFLMCEYFYSLCEDKEVAQDSAMEYIEKQYPDLEKVIEDWLERGEEDSFGAPLSF